MTDQEVLIKKTCISCGGEKCEDDFYKNRSAKDGRDPTCKRCRMDQRTLRDRENKEESVRAYFYRIMTEVGYFKDLGKSRRVMIFEVPATKVECDKFLVWLKDIIKELKKNYFTNNDL